MTKGRKIEAKFFIVTPDGRQLETIAGLLDSGELRSTVAAVYPLAEGRRAYDEGPHLGRPGRTVLVVKE